MYRGLRTLLYALSALEAIAALILLFATNWALSLAPASLGLANLAFVGLFLKGLGIVALAIGYLLCVTARDPARYVAVIDALIFLFIASAALLAFALGSMHLGQYFPANYVVVRIVVSIALAIVLFWMRPKVPKTSTF